jgi:cold shock CspA family protein
MKTHQGTIVLWNPTKAWGFIRRDHDSERIFYHRDNVIPGFIPSLALRVEFEMAPPLSIGKKDQAINVRDARGAL